MVIQAGLFGEVQDRVPAMPEGFRYEEDVISQAEEATLVASLATLELKPFEFPDHVGNRRVTAFGLRYDYARRAVEVADGCLLSNASAGSQGRSSHQE